MSRFIAMIQKLMFWFAWMKKQKINYNHSSMILKKLGSKKIILATPVISKRTKKELAAYQI